MRLKVNGKEYVTENDTLTELLREMDVLPGRVAVEVNLTIVKRDTFDIFRLKDGDSIEIVNFVGGGSLEEEWKIN